MRVIYRAEKKYILSTPPTHIFTVMSFDLGTHPRKSGDWLSAYMHLHVRMLCMPCYNVCRRRAKGPTLTLAPPILVSLLSVWRKDLHFLSLTIMLEPSSGTP